MKLSRQSRVLSALVALVCVLFTQLAVAAYLCPSMQISQVVESAAMTSMAAEHQQMGHHHEMSGSDQAPVCQNHAQTGIQSLDKPELPSISPFVASMLVQTLAYSAPAPQAAALPPVDLLLTRTTAPPLSIRNCCFRI